MHVRGFNLWVGVYSAIMAGVVASSGELAARTQRNYEQYEQSYQCTEGRRTKGNQVRLPCVADGKETGASSFDLLHLQGEDSMAAEGDNTSTVECLATDPRSRLLRLWGVLRQCVTCLLALGEGMIRRGSVRFDPV